MDEQPQMTDLDRAIQVIEEARRELCALRIKDDHPVSREGAARALVRMEGGEDGIADR